MALKSALSKPSLRVSQFAEGSPESQPRSAGEKKAVSVIAGNVKAFALANRLAENAKAKRSEAVGDVVGPDAPDDDKAAPAPAGVQDPSASPKDTSKPKPKETMLEIQKRKQEEQDRKEEEEMMALFSNVAQPEFKPAPLHVRGLCQAAKRACHRELVKESARLHAAETLLGQWEDSKHRTKSGRAFVSVFAPIVAKQIADECMTASERWEAEERGPERIYQRLQYNVNVLERRRQRLANIDGKTFQQLPAQLVEAGADGRSEELV